MANHNEVDWTFFLKLNLFEISFKIHNFKTKKTLLKELLLQNQEVCRMEISKLRPFLDPKFEDVKRRWKQDYSKKYWVISLSQRERGKLIFTVLIDVFYFFLETSVFNDKTWQVETVDNSHLYSQSFPRRWRNLTQKLMLPLNYFELQCVIGKGQLISKCLYCVIVWTKKTGFLP